LTRRIKSEAVRPGLREEMGISMEREREKVAGA
jgi:hypothetical protein